MFNWENLRYFLCFVELGTLTKTAKHIGVEHATVSRRIESLEAELNICLIDKRGKRWRLTAEGQELALVTQNLSSHMNDVKIFSASRKTVEGVVTISAPPAYAAKKIVPRLVLLKNKCPNLTIKLIGTTNFADLNSAEADIAIRLCRPESGDFNIVRFDKIIMRPYALAEYTNNVKQSEWQFIGYTDAMSESPQQKLLEKLAQSQQVNFISNSIEIQLQAVIQNAGIAILPDFMAHTSNLKQVYGDSVIVERDVWLVVPTAIRQTQVIDIVIRAITEYPI